MLIIRLQRTGRTQMPLYRLVVAQKHRHVSKKVVAILGTYNPRSKDLVLSSEVFAKWSDKAEFSDTAYNILLKNKKIEGKPRTPNFTKKA
jgi:small subunit ribosomal protein S16